MASKLFACETSSSFFSLEQKQKDTEGNHKSFLVFSLKHQKMKETECVLFSSLALSASLITQPSFICDGYENYVWPFKVPVVSLFRFCQNEITNVVNSIFHKVSGASTAFNVRMMQRAENMQHKYGCTRSLADSGCSRSERTNACGGKPACKKSTQYECKIKL